MPRVPFFRSPYLARNARTHRLVRARGMVEIGANIDTRDWKRQSAAQLHDRIMRDLRRHGRGILLMHDIQPRTARMLPRLLRSMRREGFRVVHMVPPRGRPKVPGPLVAMDATVGRRVARAGLAAPVARPAAAATTRPAAAAITRLAGRPGSSVLTISARKPSARKPARLRPQTRQVRRARREGARRDDHGRRGGA